MRSDLARDRIDLFQQTIFVTPVLQQLTPRDHLASCFFRALARLLIFQPEGFRE